MGSEMGAASLLPLGPRALGSYRLLCVTPKVGRRATWLLIRSASTASRKDLSSDFTE